MTSATLSHVSGSTAAMVEAIRVMQRLRYESASLRAAYDTQANTLRLKTSEWRAARWGFLALGFALGLAARTVATWIGGW